MLGWLDHLILSLSVPESQSYTQSIVNGVHRIQRIGAVSPSIWNDQASPVARATYWRNTPGKSYPALKQ
ncbi:hypothetical protein TNCV_1821391 [Trichonephila clavipes]|nr:hypothetical protein TNCV_1821391 [Trichonephila clavipes]